VAGEPRYVAVRALRAAFQLISEVVDLWVFVGSFEGRFSDEAFKSSTRNGSDSQSDLKRLNPFLNAPFKSR
jgi:hypothetical protein